MKLLKKGAVIKGIILLGFAVWIGYLFQSGNISLYLSPKLSWLSRLSAMLLIVLTIALLIPSRHRAHHCCEHHHCHTDHDHSHSTLSMITIAMFCVPLLLGFTVKPQVLDSLTLVNSINTVGSRPYYVTQFSQFNKSGTKPKWPELNLVGSEISNFLTGKLPMNKLFGNSSPLTIPEGMNNLRSSISTFSISSTSSATDQNTLKTPAIQPAMTKIEETDLAQLALSENPDQIYNHSYRLIGFVYKDPRLAKNQFVLTRYVITCCIIDAQPIGFIAESPDTPNLKANTWIEVEGVLKKRAINMANQIKPVVNFQSAENTAPYFIITHWKEIPTPKDPYLTPPQ
ncbi:TIGR03943 family protein [Desulfosporosinus sp. FKB]|uniref:TIGR03943 family putative permease subunit n=1 Tax=Desulfosporosinus sp. FKB TaxID=1969835 RepID=UPI000B4994A7|nr:TIGR03943 family protein [Desulfosporosinus sp. FKB]